MDKLIKHYEALWNQSLTGFESGLFDVDPMLDTNSDNRRGMSLVIKPPKHIYQQVMPLLDALRMVEPDQYYYPSSDLHITVMPIISCYDGFEIKVIDLEKYISAISDSILSIPKITFSGLTASQACVMLRGYSENNSLDEFRNKLRRNFDKNGLVHSMDQRYRMVTAHSTIVRFKSRPKQVAKFLEVLNQFKHTEFGSFQVDKYELVYNDWYQKQANNEHLHTFNVSAVNE